MRIMLCFDRTLNKLEKQSKVKMKSRNNSNYNALCVPLAYLCRTSNYFIIQADTSLVFVTSIMTAIFKHGRHPLRSLGLIHEDVQLILALNNRIWYKKRIQFMEKNIFATSTTQPILNSAALPRNYHVPPSKLKIKQIQQSIKRHIAVTNGAHRIDTFLAPLRQTAPVFAEWNRMWMVD